MPPRLFAAAPSRLRRFESAFSALTRARGIDYAARDLVRIVAASSDTLVAEVRGHERYEVALLARGHVLGGRCSCPHFAGGDACKHLWATLMVAERERVLPGSDELRTMVLEPPPEADPVDPPDADPLHEAAEAWAAAELGPILPERRSRASRQRPEAPGWRELLAATAVPRADDAGRSAFAYVIDASASRRRDALVVRVLEPTGKRPGAPWQPARFGRPFGRFVSESDALVLAMLEAVSETAGGFAYAYGLRRGAMFEIARPSCLIMERLLACGRVRLGEPGGPPLRWEAEPYSVALSVTRAGTGDDLLVRADLERGQERVPAREAALIVGGRFVLWPDRAAPLDDHGQAAWLAAERASAPAILPAHELDDFVDAVLQIDGGPPLRLPAGHDLPEVRVGGHPYAFLQTRSRLATEGGPLIEAGVDYEGVRVSLLSRGRAILDRARRRVVLRDRPAEDVALAQLEAAGVRAPSPRRPGPPAPAALRIPLTKVESAARALVAAGWRVEVDGRLRRAAGELGVRVATGIDWMEVRLEARFDGVPAPFPELLAALRERRQRVVLADGSAGDLSDEQIDRLRRWVAMAAPGEDALRFHRVQAPLVAALVDGDGEASVDSAFATLRRDLDAFVDGPPLDASRSFRGALREYQRHALGWFAALRRLGFGGCLADDMGLGKTVQVLAMLDARRKERPAPGPSLVVAPRSVLFNWAAEAARFTPRVRVLVHDGAARVEPGDHFAGYDLVLTTYGVVRSDLEALSSIAFDYVVLDEAQAIKTARTATAQAVRALRSRHRLAMTGTPVENHLGELAALLDFLNPGLLGASSALSALAQGNGRIDDASRAVLGRAVRPFFLRRTKRQVAPELPDRVEQTLDCELEGDERRRYDELHRHYRSSLAKRVARDGVGRSTAHILEALLRLRQAACHPGLLDVARRGEPSAKLEVLLDHLGAVLEQGQKALVFSQFTSFLSIVRDRLEARGVDAEYLDGATTDRAERVARFQSDERCGVFLLSLKAGGTGLNLTAAEYVFLLDPWWNPAVEAQAIDRAHRIGQTRTVLAYRLIARHTVEEKVALLQAEKRALADALFGGASGAVSGLTRDDLELLLS